MSFSLFQYVDSALVDSESREPRASMTPSVWPSEASALRLDPTEGRIYGRCHRASFLRMIGWPVSDQVDAIGAWRWVTGRQIESHLIDLAKGSKTPIYVASGVRDFIPDLYLPLELDLVVMDPNTTKGYIAECKTYYGYMADKEIRKLGKPKIENVMQLCLYLLEIGTGARLKQVIQQGLADKETGRVARNRIDADLSLMTRVHDGPLGAKLIYVSRDECQRTEFDISIWQDIDGSHYPVVNGDVWKLFTVDSIYDRYKKLQSYWFRARNTAYQALLEKGIRPPETLSLLLTAGQVLPDRVELTEEQKQAERLYIEHLEGEMRRLPASFWPPAEYEWAYSAEKIDLLFGRGAIGKIRYQDYKKRKPGKDRIGDWQCLLPGTMVERSNGSIAPIEQLLKGDRTRLGRITEAKSKPVDREVVEIHPFNLLPLRLTHDHEVKTSSGRFFPAGELQPMEARKVHSYQRFNYGDELVVPFDTAQIPTGLFGEELAGIALWLAEGHYRRADENDPDKHFGIGYTIHPQEDELAAMIYHFAESFQQRYTKEKITVTDRVKEDSRTGHHYRVISLNSVAAAKFMKQWTLGSNSHSKALPMKLRRAPLEEQAILLRWLKAGDGCTTAMRGSQMHVYTSVSQQLAHDVQRMLWRQSRIAGVIEQKMQGGFSPNGAVYHVRWYDGPSPTSRIHNGIFFTKIQRVLRNVPYEGLVYDVTVEPSHEIATISGVVHNCSYCSYRKVCVPKQNSALAYQIFSLEDLQLDTSDEDKDKV